MDIYLLRHAIAEVAANPPSGGDARRRLTTEGAEKMRRAAAGMKAMELSFDLILSSPLLRAKETAEIVAKVFQLGKRLELAPALAPDGNPKELIDNLSKHRRGVKRVLLVGHEPYLSRLVSLLTCGDTRLSMDFKKGALCKLSAEELEYGRCAKLEWLLTSRQLRRLG